MQFPHLSTFRNTYNGDGLTSCPLTNSLLCGIIPIMQERLLVDTIKHCKHCKQDIDTSQDARRWQFNTCPDCRQIKNRKWRSPIRQQWATIKKRYKLSQLEWLEKLEQQGYKCDCCSKPLLANPTRTYVDHNHETGKVRGLVCPRCNSLLKAVDDKEWLKQGLAYKAKWDD